jgi:hypothetical protein
LTIFPREPVEAKSVEINSDQAIIKDVKVQGEKGIYEVTGLVFPTKRIYYTVEDGHNELLHETKINIKHKPLEWIPFTLNITIPIEKLPQNGVLILNLYEKDEDGHIENHFPFVLESFNQTKQS